ALIIPKIAYLAFLIKFIIYFSVFNFFFNNLFFFSGLISIIIGSLGAILQTKIKRLFAFSAVANFGYVMVSLSTGNYQGYFNSILFLIIYLIVNFSIFLIFLNLNSRFDNIKLKSLNQLTTVFLSGRVILSFFLSI